MFCLTTEYKIKKLPVPTKRATAILHKVQSSNALLCMLLVYICIYLKSLLRYKILILDACHPDTYLRIYVSKELRISGYCSKPKEVREQNSSGNTLLCRSVLTTAQYVQFRNSIRTHCIRLAGYHCGALRYRTEGRGFDSRGCHWNFSLTQPSGRTVTLGSTQRLTDMSTRNISWGVKAAGA
jgi:hypothetical protein